LGLGVAGSGKREKFLGAGGAGKNIFGRLSEKKEVLAMELTDRRG